MQSISKTNNVTMMITITITEKMEDDLSFNFTKVSRYQSMSDPNKLMCYSDIFLS